MKKIVIGMSGGVDSSVAAYLLKQQGYEVIGVTMLTYPADINNTKENMELWSDAVKKLTQDAEAVAEQLGIEHYNVDFGSEFRCNVVDYFVNEYRAGRTPNPCVMCNRAIKWECLLKFAESVGASTVATGHYARIITTEDGRYALAKAATIAKDQTYALCRLTQEQLSSTIMPLGEYTKDEVRKIALDAGIKVASKPDSQEICFIPDNDYGSFIEKYTGQTDIEGNFVNTAGEVIGRHKGITHYTVGQRKGLGVTYGKPVFVLELRSQTNEIVLGNNNEAFSDTVCADNFNYVARSSFNDGERVTAKIRYSHAGALASVYNTERGIRCVFDEPQRAVTPGQALVLYDGDILLGGGRIYGI